MDRVVAVTSPAKRLGLASLSRRELEVARLVALGLTDQEIAGRLSVSPRTVNSHVANAMRKSKSRNRIALAVLTTRAGLLEARD